MVKKGVDDPNTACYQSQARQTNQGEFDDLASHPTKLCFRTGKN